jgi:hypothetical protein
MTRDMGRDSGPGMPGRHSSSIPPRVIDCHLRCIPALFHTAQWVRVGFLF